MKHDNTSLHHLPVALHGVRLKVDRACEHLEAYEDALPGFRKSQPCRCADESDPDTGDKVWRVQGQPIPPPFHWNAIVGDCLHNFRSALDHLAWQLVLANNNTPTRSTAFPLCDSTVKWQSRSTQDKLNGIDPAAVALIKETQPCFGWNRHRNETLLKLENLDIADKHRHLNLTVTATSGGWWLPGLPITAPDEVFIYEGPVDEHKELARVPQKYSYVQFAPVFDIAFGTGTPAVGEIVLMVLISIREVLAAHVLPPFYPFIP
jgi:hypothetical protein